MSWISEAFLSRDGSQGESYERELIYFAHEYPDETSAAGDVLGGSPLLYEGIPRRGASRKQISANTWEVRVQYKLDPIQQQPSDPDTDTFNTSLSFNLVGGTEHITTAFATTSYVPFTGTVLDVKKTIGNDVKTGQVRGVDVFAPVTDFSFTTQFYDSIVTDAYVDALSDLTGKTNNATFKRKPIGSVLFKGARGSKRGQLLWEITFEFAYQKNKTGIVIGDVIPFDKKGWQYVETMFKDSPTLLVNGKALQVPYQVNVHDVYESGDYSLMKIGTA